MATDGNGNALNGLDRYLEQIGEQDDELASMRGAYMADCRGPRGRIKEIKGQAREAGNDMPAFNELLAKYRFDRRHAQRIADLEPDSAQALEEMKVALGGLLDLPLGQAAVERVEAEQQDNLSL